MDVDEIVERLSEDEREALLQRLQEQRSEESGGDLRERVARLEYVLQERGPMHRGRGPRGGYGWGCGCGGPHVHHHCPHCGW